MIEESQAFNGIDMLIRNEKWDRYCVDEKALFLLLKGLLLELSVTFTWVNLLDAHVGGDKCVWM